MRCQGIGQRLSSSTYHIRPLTHQPVQVGNGVLRSVNQKGQCARNQASAVVSEQSSIKLDEVADESTLSEANLSELVSDGQRELDALYNSTFSKVKYFVGQQRQKKYLVSVTEAQFSELGRQQPEELQALIDAVGVTKWKKFQAETAPIKLRLTRLQDRLQQLRDQQLSQIRAERAAEERALSKEQQAQLLAQQGPLQLSRDVHIVIVCGIEAFNVDLYATAAQQVARACPQLKVEVFSERDIAQRESEVAAALERADVFFGSLLFDFDQVQ